MTRFIFPALASFLAVACTDTVVKTIPAEAGAGPAPTTKTDAEPPVTVDPFDAGADAGIVGRRLGDPGCEGPEDCDSNVCFTGALGSYCTKECSESTAQRDCPPPLAGTCGRQFVCDRAE